MEGSLTTPATGPGIERVYSTYGTGMLKNAQARYVGSGGETESDVRTRVGPGPGPHPPSLPSRCAWHNVMTHRRGLPAWVRGVGCERAGACVRAQSPIAVAIYT